MSRCSLVPLPLQCVFARVAALLPAARLAAGPVSKFAPMPPPPLDPAQWKDTKKCSRKGSCSSSCGSSCGSSCSCGSSSPVHWTMPTHATILSHDFSLVQLKTIAAHYRVARTGTKYVLLERIFVHLVCAAHATTIQKWTRRMFVRKYLLYRGPAFRNRSLCVNESDFVTLEPVHDIAPLQFISVQDDAAGVVYGFDLNSLYNHLFGPYAKAAADSSAPKYLNPYTRQPFGKLAVRAIKRSIRWGPMLCVPLLLQYPMDADPPQRTIEEELQFWALDVFQTINALGHFTDSRWFLSLNKAGVLAFLVELTQIWFFRAGASDETRVQICPNHLRMFRAVHDIAALQRQPLPRVQHSALCLMEELVTRGVDASSRALGAFYVLGALTLVSPTAAGALPWLYESML